VHETARRDSYLGERNSYHQKRKSDAVTNACPTRQPARKTSRKAGTRGTNLPDRGVYWWGQRKSPAIARRAPWTGSSQVQNKDYSFWK
jgi:hypothetical protein